MDTRTRDCLALFDTTVGGRLDPGWAAGVLHQRTRTTKAGPMVYVESFPIWDTRTAARVRSEAAKEAHREAQARQDEKNARKKLVRKINANFDAGDMLITCEYPLHKQPQDEAQAQRDVQNYIRRVKTLRKRRGLPELRYIYVTEATQSAKYGQRVHHHVLLSGDGVTQDELEAVWIGKHGGLCNCRRAQPNDKHLTGLAKYLTADKRKRTMEQDGKNPQQRCGRRRWNCSKNLIDPPERVADKKISIRKAGQIAGLTLEEARPIFRRLYPDCVLLDLTVKRSPWAAGVYIEAELRRVSSSSSETTKNRRRAAQHVSGSFPATDTGDHSNIPSIPYPANCGKGAARRKAKRG